MKPCCYVYIIHVLLIIILYNFVLTFKAVSETLICDRSNKSY